MKGEIQNGLAIVSGGMDSVVMLHSYKHKIGLVAYFDYGSNHSYREKACSREAAELLGKKWLCIDLPFIKKYFSSGLLEGPEAIPDGHYEAPSMKKTVVPFRNGIMLAIAAGIAESWHCDALLIANHAGDHAIYPDCRPTFISLMNLAIKTGTYEEIQILSPFNLLTKKQIAKIGLNIGVDFRKTYSCYKGGEVHCGTCGTCTERKEALESVGNDPTEYLA